MKTVDGMWVYGYYTYIVGIGHKIYEQKTAAWHIIDPKTLGQFIGIKDTKNIEIYRGDLVSLEKQGTWEVVYEMQGFRLRRAIGREIDEDQPMSDIEDNDITIVGDIWRNTGWQR